MSVGGARIWGPGSGVGTQHATYFNEEFRDLYNINEIIADDGYVYCEILKGMYGLKQTAILAYLQLKEKLNQHRYEPIPCSNGLWKHKTRQKILRYALTILASSFLMKTM